VQSAALDILERESKQGGGDVRQDGLVFGAIDTSAFVRKHWISSSEMLASRAETLANGFGHADAAFLLLRPRFGERPGDGSAVLFPKFNPERMLLLA